MKINDGMIISETLCVSKFFSGGVLYTTTSFHFKITHTSTFAFHPNLLFDTPFFQFLDFCALKQ